MNAILAELKNYRYVCAPEQCGERVCCRIFDIAVTAEERERIGARREELASYCPWLAATTELFTVTPHFILLKKRDDGLCVFNYAANGGYYCALHALALARGENPYRAKPRGCATWPFLADNDGTLHLDKTAPCLRRVTPPAAQADANLLALISELKVEN
ncbi:hypothetical protein AGMMS49959_03080 [Planctomycetales bacterium]|nr:hypothetical protein AGMMS49959_03080 [Planctomycetales bacterium]